MCEQQTGASGTNVSAFEAVTRLMVENLADDVKEIRNRINGMFWLIAGTVVIDVFLRVAGMGG